jgi:aminoglycoside phosphotransferase (APT) family kinase protein
MRRPPISHVLESAHDMAREYTIISCLGPTDIPVPPALGLCQDKSVNGADFYVMRFVEGRVYEDSMSIEEIPFAMRRPLGFEIADILARLHRVDPDSVGLGELGRRTNYAQRQVRRWLKQWENSRTEEVQEIEEVGQWLKEHVPEQSEVTIVHGDFRIGNFIVNNHQIAAVLDWELCTLGDPRADVGWLLNWWQSADEVERGKGDQAPTAAGGFPSREEILDAYQEKTGRDLSWVNYFRALSYWRLAVISAGVYKRYFEGAMGKSDKKELERFKSAYRHQARKAHEMIENSG